MIMLNGNKYQSGFGFSFKNVSTNDSHRWFIGNIRLSSHGSVSSDPKPIYLAGSSSAVGTLSSDMASICSNAAGRFKLLFITHSRSLTAD